MIVVLKMIMKHTFQIIEGKQFAGIHESVYSQ